MKLLAPNGKPSNLTPEQYRLVRTPAFKKWFGDWENSPETASKVVDENGEPLVVLHKTSAEDFYVFDKDKIGDANSFTTLNGFFFGNYKKQSDNLRNILCFLSIKNPIVLNQSNTYFDSVGYQEAVQHFIQNGTTDYLADYLEYEEYDNEEINEILDNWEYADGVIVKNLNYDNFDTEFVAFEPEQIKLADGTNTTFDGNNPDIRYADGGSIDYSLKEVYPDIFLFQTESQKDLALSFARCQAFYEWDEFKGKKFTIKDFFTWYKFNHPNLKPYWEEFYGFNVPSDSIFDCYKVNEERNIYDDLLLSAVSKIPNKNFYLIGTVKGDDRALDHELAHAFFWKDEEYRNDMISLVNSIPNKDELLRILKEERGYGKDVLFDEAQAFLSTGLITEISDWQEYTKAFTERFMEQKNTNTTTFDANNPDIRYEIGGSVMNYLKDIRKTTHNLHNTSNTYTANFGRYGRLTWEVFNDENNKEEENPEYIVVQSIDRYGVVGYNPTKVSKEDSKGEGAMAIASLFLIYPSLREIGYDDESYFEDNTSFWERIGGDIDILKREDFFNYYNKKHETYEQGGVTYDQYTSKEIKKAYVSIRINYEYEKVSDKLEDYGKYQIKSYDENNFQELKEHKLKGIIGVSTSNYNISEWLVHRECLVVMPFDKFLELNDTEQVQYYDADYLSAKGFDVLHRLYDRKGRDDNDYYAVLQNIFPKISQEFNLEGMSKKGTEYTNMYVISELFNVYNSSRFLSYVSGQDRINSPEDLANIIIGYVNSGQIKNDYPYNKDVENISVESIVQPIRNGIVNSGKVYVDESEWLIKNKELVIPQNSQLFFVLKGYENARESYEDIISKYDLKSSYKIGFVNQQKLTELQNKRVAIKNTKWKKEYQNARNETNKKIIKALKNIQNEIVEDWTDRLIQEFREYDDNFRDWDGNEYGDNILDVPSAMIYFDSLILKFIDIYDSRIENIVKTKNKFEFSYIFNDFVYYLDDLQGKEGDDELEAYGSNKIYKYDFLQKLRYYARNQDVTEIGDKIKTQVGSNLYRYFTKDELFFKKGGEITEQDKKETYKKWKDLVNMSASELKNFMDSDEGREAGLSKQEADKLGIHYGRESAKWILKMKDTPVSEWTPDMWSWAKRQISFNSRMRGNKGKLYDDKGRKTRKHLSLLIWGHNPEKYEMGGDILFDSNGGEITLTSEQVENKLGRKLHWWNDDVVNINGIEYKKVFLKPEYKRL